MCPAAGLDIIAVVKTLRVVAVVLILIVLGFAVRRVLVDVAHVAHASVPAGPDRAYALHPGLAYLHIVPGLVYLLGAPLQLSVRFGRRHLRVHRRMGRVVAAAGVVSGAFAIVFGTLFPQGGVAEAAATVVFGGYFLVALGTAFAAIRARDVARHRRWMVRAFAVGVAVGTLRIWVGLFQALDLLSWSAGFAVAFPIASALHALVAEAHLRRAAAPGTHAPIPALTSRRW